MVISRRAGEAPVSPRTADERRLPRTAERRSPRALAHDPPVTRTDWTLDREFRGVEFLDDARVRGGWDDAAWERLRRHGGMHLDRRRLDAASPPDHVAAGTQVVAYSFACEPQRLEFPPDAILLDEGGLVAVNKPPWWCVQGTRASRLVSLERELRTRLDCARLTPIHRLDRETSGVILFAREGRVAGDIGKQLARREVRKEYVALVHPAPVEDTWIVEGRIVRIEHPSHSLFELRREGSEGLPSATRFEVAERRGEQARVRAFPLTGRTHQLRVHLVASGCPIVGDSLYSGGWSPGASWSAERLQLHASSIAFLLGGREMRIEAPIPADFG